MPAPAPGPAHAVRHAIDEAFRAMGLLAVAPWALVAGACLFGGLLIPMVARVPGVPGRFVIGGALLTWGAIGLGIVLTGVMAISGHVSTPASRVVGGVLAGLGAALGVATAACAGAVGLADPVNGLFLLAVAALGVIVAAPAASVWARKRYDAGPVGAAIAAAWPVFVVGVPLVFYGGIWTWTT